MLTRPVALTSPLQAPFEPSSPAYRAPSFAAGSATPRRALPRLQLVDSQPAPDTQALVQISPPDAVTRRTVIRHGMAAEIIQTTRQTRTEYRFRASVHLLAVYEEATRDQGESFVEGLPRSSLRTLSRKITFVPAGYEYVEWHEPRTLARVIYFYFEPSKLDVLSDGDAGISMAPRLLFENSALWDSARKLKRSIEGTCREDQRYFEAIGTVLMHELVGLERGASAKSESYARGGLAMHHQRIVTAYIEEHLHEQVSVATLAGLAHLSPFHFCRAFKQSFGVPPHRYHTARRIEHAKTLLAKRDLSVTEIGLTVGFSETSSFSTAFRKATGVAPRAYRMGFM
jgi:AraC family transcriptional regulator